MATPNYGYNPTGNSNMFRLASDLDTTDTKDAFAGLGENWSKAGAVLGGLSDIGSLYANWQGAGIAKDNYKLAKDNSMFSNQMSIAGVMQALDVNKAKNMFMGGDGSGYGINQYLPQETLDKYNMGGMQGVNGLNQNVGSDYTSFGGNGMMPQGASMAPNGQGYFSGGLNQQGGQSLFGSPQGANQVGNEPVANMTTQQAPNKGRMYQEFK